MNKSDTRFYVIKYFLLQKIQLFVIRSLHTFLSIIFKSYVNKNNKNGAFSLFAASQNGHSTVVQNLIDNKASIDQVMINGVTPLYIATNGN